MGLLIAYGTTRCRTGKSTQAVASRICESGHNSDWFATLGRVANRRPKPFDGNKLSGPLHEQWHPERVDISRIDVGNNIENAVWQPDQDLLATEQSMAGAIGTFAGTEVETSGV